MAEADQNLRIQAIIDECLTDASEGVVAAWNIAAEEQRAATIVWLSEQIR
jgi:hypothetical protein